MLKRERTEQLVRDSRVASDTVCAVALFISFMDWITADQFTILLAISFGLRVAGWLVGWRMLKAVNAKG